jgi:hypothetical protein
MIMRPLFLSRITRRKPSFKWFVRRLANRILRHLRGIEREPIASIAPLTEAEWRRLESRCGMYVGLLFASVVCLLLLLLSGRTSCL